MFPRTGVWTYLVGAIWYGIWLVGAALCGKVVSDPSRSACCTKPCAGALCLMVLYWQVVPVLMSATGASLDLQRLKVYPIRLRTYSESRCFSALRRPWK